MEGEEISGKRIKRFLMTRKSYSLMKVCEKTVHKPDSNFKTPLQAFFCGIFKRFHWRA